MPIKPMWGGRKGGQGGGNNTGFREFGGGAGEYKYGVKANI